MGIELDAKLKDALLDKDNLPESLVLDHSHFTDISPVEAGFKGVIWFAKDKFERPRAIKLAMSEDYEEGERTFVDEIKFAEKISETNMFARLHDAGKTTVILKDGTAFECVYFVEDWVDGISIKKFLAKKPQDISVNFLRSFILSLVKALFVLDKAGLRHDDLHSGNVMLCTQKEPELEHDFQFKIIDMGSLKLNSGPTSKQKDSESNWDDHLRCVEQIVDFYNLVWTNPRTTQGDRRYLIGLKSILERMTDDDKMRALRSPKAIRKEEKIAYDRSRVTSSDETVLTNPFSYISTEQITSDKLLLKLFADSCPWLEKVSGPDSCLVTGPRGCGKSTIFRWLSLKPHLSKPFSEVMTLPFAGFYIPSSVDLENRFYWITEHKLAERFKYEIVHYFNMLLTKEILVTLEAITDIDGYEKEWKFDENNCFEVLKFLSKHTGCDTSKVPQGLSSIQRCKELVSKELYRTYSAIIDRKNIRNPTPDSYIGDLTKFLHEEFVVFNTKKIVFLIDDFSHHRVPIPVQRVLLKVIWARIPYRVFKISSEKYGTEFAGANEEVADLAREMKEIDCGAQYINLTDHSMQDKAIHFATELLNNRLKAANYAGTAEDIISVSDWPNKSLARCLIANKGNPKSNCYHGIDCISKICSGDISTLLMIYEEIFSKGEVDSSTKARVAPHIQHDAIKNVSRRMIERIKTIYPYGKEMYDIVLGFGEMLKTLLYSGITLKGGTPYQAPRIEINARTGDIYSEISETSREIAKSLIQRSIFIELNQGAGRDGVATTLRWHIRRIYLPHFLVSLSKTTSIKKESTWLEELIVRPKEACKGYSDFKLADLSKKQYDGSLQKYID